MDHLGSTTMVTDHTGATTQKTIYYPWGQMWRSAGTVKDERFASMEQRDTETGNDHTLFRQYASNLGRWMSPDPLAGDISNPQSLNRYAYVMNNPTNFIDPLGLDPPKGPPPHPGCGDDPTTQCVWERYGWTIPGMFGAGTVCYVDDVRTPCDTTFSLLQSGAATLCLNSDCTLRLDENRVEEWIPPHGPPDDVTPGSWETVLQVAGNFSSGAADVLTFRGLILGTKTYPSDEGVDTRSGTYLAGTATGTAILWTTGEALAGPDVLPNTILNANRYARLGWARDRGQATYRFVVGSRRAFTHAHLDLYPKAAVPAVVDFFWQLFQ